jgi:pimeloyl-ACP methyl ester carboxylesterase
MGASGFGTLAEHFADRTVVTYDPRGAERSKRTDDATESTPDEHADDLHRLISALGAGPVDMFASSGGAVNALALVARHPEQVRILVAHEPPASQELPGSARRWRSSSRSSVTRVRSRLGSPTGPLRIPPISVYPPRMMARGMTRSWGRT